MTNQQVEKIGDHLAVILEQIEMLSYYGVLLEQRKPRLEEIEGQVLQIRDILKEEKKALGKKSGKSKLKIRKSLIAPDNRKRVVMTNQQIEKIRHSLTIILHQVEFMSCYGRLSEQRKERLKEVKRQVLKIKGILRGMIGKELK
ncbi:MAG: hypothetical protein E3J76_01940 [Candidatus Aminicenantes bacterium]|nr:MAG: hypothetical protein E3J76_01940 [Candidatus Aminicenantes bacterium]